MHSKRNEYIHKVKKLIFFILALQIITSGKCIPELMKLNSLMEHFIEHKKSEHPISLIEFFRLHYFDHQHETSDPQRHASLPLHHTGFSFTIVFHAAIDTLCMEPIQEVTSNIFHAVSKGLMPQCHQVSIFQPPRLA